MYIKDEKAHAKALIKLEALMDFDPDPNTPESKRLVQVAKAIQRYEKWSLDDGAPRKWQLTQQKLEKMGWKRPEPLDPDHLTNWERMLERSLAKAYSVATPESIEAYRKMTENVVLKEKQAE